MSGRTLRSFALRLALVLTAALAVVAPGSMTVRAQQPAPSESRETAAHYSCPMHPSVESPTPGTCPKCRMDLRPLREGAAAATAPHAGATVVSVAPAATSGMKIPDIELLDQNGGRVRFYSDLVRGKVVVINFIFTTCTTVCPPLGATFARVQKELGERAGRDAHLISISVDPLTDTPERLKTWGAKFKAGPGWTFVTGAKPQVDELLRALAASSARREDHTPTVIIGNDATGQWTRTYGLAAPGRIVQIIGDAAEGRLGQNSKESKR